jgi:hypothetical protein
MRTAITLGKSRADGQWKLLAGPDILNQKAAFNERCARPVDDLFSEIRYQDSHGHARTVALRTNAEVAKAEIEKAKQAADRKKAEDDKARLEVEAAAKRHEELKKR